MKLITVTNKDTNRTINFNSALKVAYDGCHKIYICSDENDVKKAIEFGYEIHDITELESLYNNSCPLVFIRGWKTLDSYIPQYVDAEFGERGVKG